MKKNIILGFGWVAFAALFFVHQCEEKETITVKVPEIVKQFETKKEIVNVPIEVPKYYKDRKNEQKLTNDILEMYQVIENYQNEIEWMQQEFQISDSIQKSEMYRLATQLKKFESEFEDENLKLTIRGIVGGGEVKEITPDYVIKEREIETEIPQKKYSLWLSGNVGTEQTRTDFLYQAQGTLQISNKKKYHVSWQRLHGADYFLVGYGVKVF